MKNKAQLQNFVSLIIKYWPFIILLFLILLWIYYPLI